MHFTFQIMPAFFQCIDTESFYNEKHSRESPSECNRTSSTILDLLDTRSMEWSTVLAFTCPSCLPLPIHGTPLSYQEISLVFQMDI